MKDNKKKSNKLISLIMSISLMLGCLFIGNDFAVNVMGTEAVGIEGGSSMADAAKITNFEQSYISKISVGGEEDWYSFTTPDYDCYTLVYGMNQSIDDYLVNFTYSLRMDVNIYSKYEEELKAESVGEGKDATLYKKLSKNTTYYLRIRHQKNTGIYKFSIKFNKDSAGETKDKAESVNLGQQYERSLDAPDDIDYFSFVASEGGEYSISAENYNMGSWVSGNSWHYFTFVIETDTSKEWLKLTLDEKTQKTQNISLFKGKTYYIKCYHDGNKKMGNYAFSINKASEQTSTPTATPTKTPNKTPTPTNTPYRTIPPTDMPTVTPTKKPNVTTKPTNKPSNSFDDEIEWKLKELKKVEVNTYYKIVLDEEEQSICFQNKNYEILHPIIYNQNGDIVEQQFGEFGTISLEKGTYYLKFDYVPDDDNNVLFKVISFSHVDTPKPTVTPTKKPNVTTKPTNKPSNSVFDNAIEWKPLKLMDLNQYGYYQITLEKEQNIYFHRTKFTDYNDYMGDDMVLYKPDGTIVDRKNTLKKGIYYVYMKRSYDEVWYTLTEESSQTDLTIDNNVKGTVFEGYSTLKPMELYDKSVDDAWKVYKIVLNKPNKIEFRCDSCGGNFLARPYIFYDSYGREIEKLGTLENNPTYNLEAGTYFLRAYYSFTNLYYIESNPDEATKVTVTPQKASLSLGQTINLKYTLEPVNCIDTVEWSSSNTNIATVDENGKVTARGIGECLITATARSGVSSDCKVTVIEGQGDIPQEGDVVLGDINQDGNVDLSDTLIALKAALGIETLDAQKKNIADVDGNGDVTLEDVLKILKTALGIESL